MPKPFHKFKSGDKHILLDICGGGVYVIDEEIYHALDERNAEGGVPYDKAYQELLDAGLFAGGDDYRAYADMNVNAPLKALCLHVSHDCNLRCEYCFAEGIIESSLMSEKTAKAAVDFLVCNSGERENLEIDFFGGEPLMAWETVKKTAEYANAQGAKHCKDFKLTLTTNGLLLDDEKIAFINENFHNVVLSLDGRREINDKMRRCKNGAGSYDVVLPKFKKLVQTRTKAGFTDYFIRGTFTGYNLDFADDVSTIAGEGFRNISIEPAAVCSSLPYALREEHLPRIRDEYDRLLGLAKKSDWRFFHFYVDLFNSPCILKRLRGCGTGNEYVAVTPDGNIFPCHRYVGLDDWKMGNITVGADDSVRPLDEKIKAYFAKMHIYAKENCPDCWARFYCGGGCNAESLLFEGDAAKQNELTCELMKKRFECAIALAITRATDRNL
jgi:uncharacterized protein